MYDTNAKLSRLLQKTTNGITTKYVYGRGLIGEEKQGCFKTYHFDYRGSTVAITDACGHITDTFAYDTYGKLISRTGSSFVIFGYNGRDGVVTDKNGLIYMRARYYSPELRRFVNADVVPGEISNAVTLNRYAYANGNPVSNVDPFGLSAEREGANSSNDFWSWLQTAGMWIMAFFDPDTYKTPPAEWIYGILFASGSASLGNFEVDLSALESGTFASSDGPSDFEGWFGLGLGANVANAQGSFGIGDENLSLSINGNVDFLTAEAKAGVTYKKGLGVNAEAGAAVLSGKATIAIKIYDLVLEVGVNLDALTAEAKANYGFTKTLDGKTKIGIDEDKGLGWFGWGLVFNLTLPF